MFAKVYQYKFGTVSEANVAASFCADNLGKKISQYKFQSLNVMIGKDGDLSIFIKFNTIERLKKYEDESNQFVTIFIFSCRSFPFDERITIPFLTLHKSVSIKLLAFSLCKVRPLQTSIKLL